MPSFYRFFLCLVCFTASHIFAFSQLYAADKHQDFIVFAPPKCGTHLIGKILQLMLNEEASYQLTELGTLENALKIVEDAKRNNKFVIAHNFTKELIDNLVAKDYKVIFILRDPRDQLISMMHFMRNGNWTWLKVSQIADQNEQIDELITGSRYGFKCYDSCIKGRLASVNHLSSKIVCITRFEKLVGPKGGSDVKTQTKELLKIAKFIKFDLSAEKAQEVGDKAFGGTWTFREGQIGDWEKYFLPVHKQKYKTLYGRELIRLGYEKNLNW